MKKILLVAMLSSISFLANATLTEEINQYYQNTKATLQCMHLNKRAYNISEEQRLMKLAWKYGKKASLMQKKTKPYLRSRITNEYQIYDKNLDNEQAYIGYYQDFYQC
ncbi:MAG: hypothetical protein KGV51_07825 [Moraxellaceae bacterium]|nr:hypothetical protein [Moraxellaceae bacterium]